MSVYRPTYTDKKTGRKVQQEIWWCNFWFAGRRLQESTGTTRKTLAKEYEENRRHDLEKALAGVPAQTPAERVASVRDRVKAYLENYPLNHRPKSAIFAKQRLAHVQRLLGRLTLFDLTEDAIHDYIRARAGEGAGGRAINMEIGELSRALKRKWSVAWPAVRKLEENHDVGVALSPEQEKRLLEAAAFDDRPNRNESLYTFVQIALLTGMRMGEICSLKWEQASFEANVITVGKAKSKKGTGRQIPMSPELRAVLDQHASWYASKFGEIQPEWFVFPGRKGRPRKGVERGLNPTLPMQSINSSWEKLRERADVECRFHDLRHTLCTKMAEAGVPESTMLAIMGQMSRAMLERYSHIRMAAKREAMNAITLPKLTGPDEKSNEVSDAVAKESAKVKSAGRTQ
jgi:integrase